MRSEEERTVTSSIIKELWARDPAELLAWLQDIASEKVARPPYPRSTWTRFADVSKSKVAPNDRGLAMARIIVFVLEHLPELWGVSSDTRHQASIAKDARAALSLRAQILRRYGHKAGDDLLDTSTFLQKFKKCVGIPYEELSRRLAQTSMTCATPEHASLSDVRECISVLQSISTMPEIGNEPECKHWLSLLNRWPPSQSDVPR